VGVLASLLLAVGIADFESLPAQAASNGSWSVYPTTLPGYWPRVVFSPSLVPGKTVTDSVTVANLSASPLSFDLYAADAFNTPGGGLSLRRKVDPVEGIGAWIHLAHSSVLVPAHKSVAIPFVIVVPSDATPGDHVGGIVAVETTGTAASAGSVPVTVIQAVGVRVYGRVSGAVVTRLEVTPPKIALKRTIPSLFGISTTAVATIRVINGGNVVLTPVAHLKVTDSFGLVDTRSIALGPLLPGESVTRRFTVPARGGHLEARVSATATGAHSTAVSSLWVVPWGLLVAVVVLLVLAVLTLAWWRRRRRRRRNSAAIQNEDPDIDLSVSDGEDGGPLAVHQQS